MYPEGTGMGAKGILESVYLYGMDISGLATASSLADVATAVSAVPTVAQIQSGLATSAEITALQSHGDSFWTTADTVDLTAVTSALDTITALVGHWTITTNTLTTYNDAGTVLHTYTITRDTDGEITSITEAS